MNPPRTPGHQIAGTGVAVGPAAGGAKVGDRRVVHPWIGCGQCAKCGAGCEHLCSALRVLGIRCDALGSCVGSLAEMQEPMAIGRSGRLPSLPLTVRP